MGRMGRASLTLQAGLGLRRDVRFGSRLKLSISRLLFLKKADADRLSAGAPSIRIAPPIPPGTPPWPRRCLSASPRRSGRACLFNHLVSAQHYRWGHRKAKRLGGLEVYDHLKFCRKLHREIARFLAA